jgi:hypothetical protein
MSQQLSLRYIAKHGDRYLVVQSVHLTFDQFVILDGMLGQTMRRFAARELVDGAENALILELEGNVRLEIFTFELLGKRQSRLLLCEPETKPLLFEELDPELYVVYGNSVSLRKLDPYQRAVKVVADIIADTADDYSSKDRAHGIIAALLRDSFDLEQVRAAYAQHASADGPAEFRTA